MKTWLLGLQNLLAIQLDRKEDLLRGVKQAIAEYHITDGVIVSACGSVTTYCIHMVDTVTYPPIDYSEAKSGPYQIQALQGIVADGEVHAHIILADKNGAIGGHLEEGCEIFTGVEIMLIVAESGILTRETDPDYPESAVRNLSGKSR